MPLVVVVVARAFRSVVLQPITSTHSVAYSAWFAEKVLRGQSDGLCTSKECGQLTIAVGALGAGGSMVALVAQLARMTRKVCVAAAHTRTNCSHTTRQHTRTNIKVSAHT